MTDRLLGLHDCGASSVPFRFLIWRGGMVRMNQQGSGRFSSNEMKQFQLLVKPGPSYSVVGTRHFDHVVLTKVAALRYVYFNEMSSTAPCARDAMCVCPKDPKPFGQVCGRRALTLWPESYGAAKLWG